MAITSEVENTIKLNIGGKLFQCYFSTLQTFPTSKLAGLKDSTNEYFFDRNPDLFSCILDGYRKGFIHLSKDICGTTFQEELEFWELSPGHVAPCCWEPLYSSDGETDNIVKLLKAMETNKNAVLDVDKADGSIRQKIWLTLDEPSSSKLAFMWGMFISLLIVTSFVVTCMNTLPAFCDTYDAEEMNVIGRLMLLSGYNNESLSRIKHLKTKTELYYTDAACHLLLTIELLICFLVCPGRKIFVSCYIRALVMVGYIAFWVGFGMDFHKHKLESMHLIRAYVVIKYMTVLKILRLFYITKHITAFKVMRVTFASSTQELKILSFVLGIFVCLFGFVMYVAEMTFNDDMDNALTSMYWALITLTTVGYGHYVPVTAVGHVVAAACAVCGILVLALPIGVIASKFYTFYNYHKYTALHVSNYGLSLKNGVNKVHKQNGKL